ncbi:MAG TPA: hypothetical protein PKE69_11950 [Pyrinomonadaceae bacterium]|nr:hypothetical protein [Pyrinomonadaceae bacterium]
MKLQNQKLRVCLSSSENPSIIFQGSSSDVFAEMDKNIETVYHEVSSLKEASEVCRNYISRFNLGSGNFTGGQVIDDKNNFVARISYNGRVWDSDKLGKGK